MTRAAKDRTTASFGAHFLRSRTKKNDPYVRVVQGSMPDGSRFQLKRSAPTDAAAIAAIETAISQARDGAAPRTASRVTMQQVFDRWWKQQIKLGEAVDAGKTTARALSGASLLKYGGVWRKHLAPVLGKRVADTVTHSEIYDLLHEPRASKPKPLLDVLRVLFRYAAGAGIIESHRNPTLGDFGLPSAKPQPAPLTVEELDIIETHLAHRKPAWRLTDPMRLHDSFVVMRASGMRISEVLALRVRDFDPATRRVIVREHITRTIRADGASGSTSQSAPGTKTDAGERTLVLPQRAASIVGARATDKAPAAFLFATSNGTSMATENWRKELADEVASINETRADKGLPVLTNIHPHRIRATVASLIVKALVAKHGVAAGLEGARVQLGHAGTTTLRHYVEEVALVEDHSDILDQLDSVAMRERKAREIIAALADDDPFLALDVVSSARAVGVTALEPLTADQRQTVLAALEPHALRLLE